MNFFFVIFGIVLFGCSLSTADTTNTNGFVGEISAAVEDVGGRIPEHFAEHKIQKRYRGKDINPYYQI
ncbi:hypothetical protein QR680_016483 [Steinernema hermaphroditum]|uniref:Uncharacterized protein n=1 Tax=Steinernema hermaphroditum TaxID=289476 RepID=A0AA39HBC9_9BILA|nr:hypothetical protein QR680_016483 [Steinernema hermaphroditum]